MNSGEPTSTRPLTYVIIPLLALFVICSVGLFFHVRRRRRRLIAADSTIWGRGRWVTRDGTLVFVPRHYRRSPWGGGFPSQEGLNELGEAPPPYKSNKVLLPGSEGQGQGEGGTPAAAATELRDMEEGRRPPEYVDVAEPAAAVVAESRRMGV
ncbi:hypothetical protein BBK36DRAFT_1112530 [Trichoderma citrinoviride]|uniref:Uncharacterized protein n=1 Tax=Trichoderma citrinoviride TaxID=58853 RepID=A0A2T4BHE6_9HYPO|nr:hypothetical protein BBK36DRAFT_1112530 [Trichoderma citrinoviride]PTB68669.1 hypothetical protein BBK36DRAFT_1112530 [Trichoderma citrinoviride]